MVEELRLRKSVARGTLTPQREKIMFAIATPQTIPLITPGDDQPISLAFRAGAEGNPDDVSHCCIDILMPNGDVHVAHFNTRGSLIDVTFVEHKDDGPYGEPVTHDPDGKPYDATGTPGTDGYVRKDDEQGQTVPAADLQPAKEPA